MKIGRIRKDGKILSVIFHEGKPHSLAEILGIGEESIEEFFYDLVEESRTSIIRAAGNGTGRIEGSWEYVLPIPSVGQIRDFYAFEEHVKAGRLSRGLDMIPEWYEIPVFYYSGTSSLYASGEDVKYPSYTGQLDYELEIAVVIGREGRNIPAGDAMDHVFGAMLMNDWSARDEQKKEMKLNLGPAKSKDFGTSLGPFVVTMDELQGVTSGTGRLDINVRGFVNGKKYSEANLRSMYWSFGDMIERASRDSTLRRGDIIMSGTVGTGCILELGADKYGWLKRGDEVLFEADFLGKLINRVI